MLCKLTRTSIIINKQNSKRKNKECCTQPIIDRELF